MCSSLTCHVVCDPKNSGQLSAAVGSSGVQTVWEFALLIQSNWINAVMAHLGMVIAVAENNIGVLLH